LAEVWEIATAVSHSPPAGALTPSPPTVDRAIGVPATMTYRLKAWIGRLLMPSSMLSAGASTCRCPSRSPAGLKAPRAAVRDLYVTVQARSKDLAGLQLGLIEPGRLRDMLDSDVPTHTA
jgi:hypothetical protein